MVLIAVISLLLSACNKHDEPPTEIQLPINQGFLPVTIKVARSDEEALEPIREWSRDLVVVNSASELPEDPIGFPEFYSKLNFENQTLLLFYQLHYWEIESCNSNFVRNTVEKTYYWNIHYGVTDVVYEGDEKPEYLSFTRFAILVRKLPTDYEVKVTYSIHDFDPADSPWFN